VGSDCDDLLEMESDDDLVSENDDDLGKESDDDMGKESDGDMGKESDDDMEKESDDDGHHIYRDHHIGDCHNDLFGGHHIDHNLHDGHSLLFDHSLHDALLVADDVAQTGSEVLFLGNYSLASFQQLLQNLTYL